MSLKLKMRKLKDTEFSKLVISLGRCSFCQLIQNLEDIVENGLHGKVVNMEYLFYSVITHF